jgi:hypothetical protein
MSIFSGGFPVLQAVGVQRRERMVALSEGFRPLAIPVLGQFQFFPHPAAVVRCLSLTGGAA